MKMAQSLVGTFRPHAMADWSPLFGQERTSAQRLLDEAV
jgi:hypothetical protein